MRDNEGTKSFAISAIGRSSGYHVSAAGSSVAKGSEGGKTTEVDVASKDAGLKHVVRESG